MSRNSCIWRSSVRTSVRLGDEEGDGARHRLDAKVEELVLPRRQRLRLLLLRRRALAGRGGAAGAARARERPAREDAADRVGDAVADEERGKDDGVDRRAPEEEDEARHGEGVVEGAWAGDTSEI